MLGGGIGAWGGSPHLDIDPGGASDIFLLRQSFLTIPASPTTPPGRGPPLRAILLRVVIHEAGPPIALVTAFTASRPGTTS